MPNIGDKFASRAGQKGTVGVLIREQDMPFTADGIRPDIIINPHAIPSRMTIGQLVETLTGKVCTLYGAFGDCTAFLNTGPKEKQFGRLLVKEGYHSSGTQILYNGMTGEQIQSDIYIGPTYYMRLKHMVKDKINYRARGPRTLLTRQTVQGRANDGGLRVGEMERDGIIAHGISHFLQESMMIRGDEYYMAICNKTGTIAIYNSMRNLFISPMADGPIKFTGNLLNEMNIEKITRFGRSFSIVRVPYSFKLLLQELMTMNVTMRIITEDNIDQLDSMSYSNTINKLTFDENPNTSDIISKVIENSKLNTSRGFIQSKVSRKTELSKKQDNANAIMLDNQKAQESMLKDIENLGWRLDQRVLVEGVEEDQASPSKYKYIFASLVLDESGSPTELWDESEGGYEKFPNKHPVGWQEKDLVYSDGLRIPDEVMANELARNQTPSNWISSIINIYQEYSKVMYKRQLMEEAQRAAEQGNVAEVGVGQASPQGYPLSPGYTASTPPYTASSPQYTSSSPQYTASSPQDVMGIPGQPAMSFGVAAAAAAAAAASPQGSPTTPSSGGSIISNGVQFLSPQQLGGGIIVPSPLIPIKMQSNSNMPGGSILSVNNDSAINAQNTMNGSGSTKTVQLTQSSLS
jgi:hypothetical protein